MQDFASRLQSILRRGSLTVADLAYWVNRPHCTVRTWVHDGRVPGGPQAEMVFYRIALLEEWLRTYRVPEMSARQRPEWIRQVRNALESQSGFPGSDPA